MEGDRELEGQGEKGIWRGQVGGHCWAAGSQSNEGMRSGERGGVGEAKAK